jgi:Uma2 family endonuclease
VGKSCEAFIAPLDVLLPGENIPVETVETVVQPDVFVVCDPCKKTAQCILGAPDFIAEIVSPSSGSMDKVEKLNLYERTGVAEYWILDSDDATLMVFKLGTEGKYVRPETYGAYHAYSLHYMPIDMFPG